MAEIYAAFSRNIGYEAINLKITFFKRECLSFVFVEYKKKKR